MFFNKCSDLNMKLIAIILFVLFNLSLSFGQTSVQYNFSGIVTTSDGQMLSFKIVIDAIQSGGKFTGYSITNYKKKDYTKSLIKGTLNLKEKKISFQELSNVETKSTAQDSTFCYINAFDLDIEMFKKKNIIKGKFEGLFLSGEVCTTGAIVLVNKDVETLEFIIPVEEPVSKPEKDIPFDSVMTSNEKLLVDNWKKDLTIELWDGSVEDNDAIAVYLNDKLIRKKVILKNVKNKIKLPTTENTFQIKIVALNEGNSGINTLNFSIINTEDDKLYVSKLKKGEFFIIDFKKKY